MGIKKHKIILKDERVCECITLQASDGTYVDVLTLGAIIKGIYVPDRQGELENVVLDYQDIDTYIENPGYINAIIGRTAGRIAKGQFTIDGTKYQLSCNQGENTLHGGHKGIDKKVWEVVATDEEATSVTLGCKCEDGEEGYPGEVAIRVTYSYSDAHELMIQYEADTTADTLINLTNHAYFNLAGDAKERIEGHMLQVVSDSICELDSMSIPTGRLIPVEEVEAFDFNRPKLIGKDIDASHQLLQDARGYDHPWVLKTNKNAATLYDEKSGRKMIMSTDQSAVIIYTMNYENPAKLMNGLENVRRYGVCLEAQNLPIGYNEAFKEKSIIKKGQQYTQTTTYHFSVDD
ncbi:MAG: aldose epimerase family protein [Cellulosilyticaceae bacterium]